LSSAFILLLLQRPNQ